MGDAHVPGQVGDALAVGEDLGGHAVALALVDPAALRDGDACRILASLSRASVPGLGPRWSPAARRGAGRGGNSRWTHVLEEVEGLMKIDGGRGGPRVAELWWSLRQPCSTQGASQSAGDPKRTWGDAPTNPIYHTCSVSGSGEGGLSVSQKVVVLCHVEKVCLAVQISRVHAGHRKRCAS